MDDEVAELLEGPGGGTRYLATGTAHVTIGGYVFVLVDGVAAVVAARSRDKIRRDERVLLEQLSRTRWIVHGRIPDGLVLTGQLPAPRAGDR